MEKILIAVVVILFIFSITGIFVYFIIMRSVRKIGDMSNLQDIMAISLIEHKIS